MMGLWPDTQDDPLAAAWDGAERDSAEAPQGEPAPDGWREWLEALFPKHVRWGFAQHHEEFWDWVDGIGPETSPDPFVALWARGGGKSTGAELAVTKLGITGCRKYVLYVRETQEKADTSVSNIARMLESKEVERFYPKHADRAVSKFGSSQGWRRNRLITAGGFVVDALGLDVASRGAKVDEQRPDLIVLDDIDGKHDTLATTLRKIDTITTSILPAGSWNVAILAIQNLIIPNGFFTRMADGRAGYLATRTVSGPHPAVLGLEWEYVDQGQGKPRRAVVTGGTPTWQGQGLAVVQSQIDDWSMGAFLLEAQHEVRTKREGLVLKYEPARHDEDLTDEQAWAIVAQGSAFGGIDFQRWRFGFVLEAADRDGIVHQIAEYFSQNEDLEPRARVIHALCTHYRCPPRLKIWGDSANPTDIAEINRAFRKIGSPLRVVAVGREGKLRGAAVERMNSELGRNAMRLRRDVMEWCHRALLTQWASLGYNGLPENERTPPDIRRWMLGQSAASCGTEMYGSRLKWEFGEWSYPPPKPGEAQESDPDDNSADGSDLVAAKRYAVMSWWKPAKEEKKPDKPDRNVDMGLEKTLERLNEAQRHAYGPPMGLVRGKRRDAAVTRTAASARPVASTAEPPTAVDYRAGIAALLGGIAAT